MGVDRGFHAWTPAPSAEQQRDRELVSYVDQALEALEGGRAVPVSRTEAYGCSVKYGS
jgi:hypothetical protein